MTTATRTRPRLLRAAHWYAERGWQVFPLRPRSKEPFAGLGVYNATSDAAQIERWWHQWPEANVGLHCGGSGLLALDLDQYKEGYSGSSLLNPDDTETVTNLTGSGGTHLLYTMPDGARYSNATGNLPAGIDVRGHGGYIVVPPSIHPNGNAYRWEIGYGPHEISVLPMPNQLRQMLDEARAYQRKAGPPSIIDVKVSTRTVESLINRLDLDVEGPMEYERGGRKWILRTCPFNPTTDPHQRDRAAFIVIAQDGHIGAGCQHARCRDAIKASGKSGWGFLTQMGAA